MEEKLDECEKRGKEYYKKIASVAIPVVLQFTINVCLGMVDSLMVGRLGVYQLAGVGAANEVFYILGISVYGLCSGASVFIAQYFGQRDISSIRKVLSVNLCTAMTFVAVATVFSFIFAPNLVWIFAREREVVDIGTLYMRIIAPSYLLTTVSQVMSINSRAVQRIKSITFISIGAVSLNVVLNYVLIYGKLGAPELGVKGAAIATVIARVAEIAALMICIYGSKDHPLAISRKELTDFKKEDVKRVLKMSMPVMISEGGWSVANALYYVAYGLIGAKALAASQVVVLAGKICQSFYGGFANGSCILIGEELGRGHRRQALTDGTIFLKLVVAMGIVFTVALYVMAPTISDWYRFDDDTSSMITWGIRVFSAFHLIKMIGYVCVCGILRAGGDTKFCMFLDLGTSWMISIPAVFVSVTVFGVSLPIAVLFTYVGEIVKGAICLKRFYSGKWIKLMV